MVVMRRFLDNFLCIILFVIIIPGLRASECGTYISPCQAYINKVYEFIGESDKPAEQLVTNLNFYASDACVGITTSFITTASLTPIPSELVCEEGFRPYNAEYISLHFVVHSLEYLKLFNITCNTDIEEEHIYDILNNEIECFQDGLPFFDKYKGHVPSVEKYCFAIGDIDFYAKKNGTRNIRLSNNGCRDIQGEEDDL